MTTPAEVPGLEGVDPDLAAAFVDYERALLADDVARLDAAFAPGAGTLRGDAAGLLVGHDRISAFRGARGGIPPRTIVRVEPRPITPDAWLLVSVSRFRDGGSGLQTQLWQRGRDGVWRITAAHVTGRSPAFDRSVWRELGDPLVPPTATGPLDGRTVAVKDVFAVAGQPLGAGNPTRLHEATAEPADATAVAALLTAGAAVRGIARTDEFAYSIAGQNEHTGTPPNPRVPGALPGGSSSGPASAVALGQADIGLGTDTAGSIRVPASYQGLWGLRTTHGAVASDGLLPLAPTFDTVGWLTRDAATLRAAAVATLGAAASPAVPSAAPLGLAVAPGSTAGVDPATLAAFERAVAALGAARIELPHPDELFSTFRTVQQSEAWAAHGAWVDAHPGALGPDIAARFELARAVTPEAASAARDALDGLHDRIRDAIGDRVLLIPSAPGPAPARTGDPAEIERIRQATLRLTAIAGIGGMPALSVPVLEVPTAAVPDAPVGLCLVGPPGSDVALIDLAVSLFPPRGSSA